MKHYAPGLLVLMLLLQPSSITLAQTVGAPVLEIISQPYQGILYVVTLLLQYFISFALFFNGCLQYREIKHVTKTCSICDIKHIRPLCHEVIV